MNGGKVTKKEKIHLDCRHFRGDIPCRPHKTHGVHCKDCTFYDPIQKRILIIKLGAIGDVIRTTPILRKLKTLYPKALIHWLTRTPEVVPSIVDRTFRFVPEDIEVLKSIRYDLLFNLDKDREACALTEKISAKKKRGFRLKEGHCYPINDFAYHKWHTGLFDDVNRENTKSYPQEIFEICGFKFSGEEYVLENRVKENWPLPKNKPIIGLNTGCGVRWQTRLWPEAHWIELAKRLKKSNYTVVFLGGEQEHEKNKRLAQKARVHYLGHFPLPNFIDLVDQCDLVVTAVTMALHIAIGLKKKVVLFNNIFNHHEFELYGRGVILEPPVPCKGCYKNECPDPCMELISPQKVFDKIHELLS